jgi:hypothetical protein
MKYPFKTLLLAFAMAFAAVGCYTTNPTTGEQEFDEVRTGNVKIAFTVFAQSSLRRVLVKNHADHPNVIRYMTYVSTTLCELRDEGALDPAIIIRRLNQGLAAEDAFSGVPGEVIDVKNLALALYQSFYNQRHRAELDPEKFAWNVLDVMCQSIEQGTFDAIIELGLPPIVIND